MGKIFGISDLPVSTIESALEGIHYKPAERFAMNAKITYPEATDTFVSKDRKENFSNPIIKMRNGFGKLMAHFQRPLKK